MNRNDLVLNVLQPWIDNDDEIKVMILTRDKNQNVIKRQVAEVNFVKGTMAEEDFVSIVVEAEDIKEIEE